MAKSGGRITVHTASEIAAKLTQSLFSPISEQIDPIHMGEVYRSMAIAREYGRRLMVKSKNFDKDTLDSLISDYPSHGFVIDKEEAAERFKLVRACTEDETILIEELGDYALFPADKPWVRFISDDVEETEDDTTANQETVLEQPGVDGTPASASSNISPNGQAGPAAAGG